jgi:3-methyladenine DNA glycosylase Mpg
VLIRALRPTCGLDLMREGRKKHPQAARNLEEHCLCNGPINLCWALGITHDLDGKPLRDTPLRLHNRDARHIAIKCGPRVLPNPHQRKKWFRAKDWSRRYVPAEYVSPSSVGKFLSKPLMGSKDFSPAVLSELRGSTDLKRCLCS